LTKGNFSLTEEIHGTLYNVALAHLAQNGYTASMSKKLYFGNLPFTTTAADLTKLVKPFAEVISARIGLDKKTYKSRGFGFVEVPDEAAQSVITALNGTQFHGRSLTVNESQPHPPPSPRRSRREPLDDPDR